jgi:triacylglycerol lipase
MTGVAALGKRWDRSAYAETLQLYADVHASTDWPGIRPAETVRYGGENAQTLVLFRPEQGFSEPGPVFVVMGGDGLPARETAQTGGAEPQFEQVGKLGAAAGGIGIVMHYRTGGTAAALDGAEDLRLALEWIKRNISDIGGDPNTVVLIANSEGATAAATYLFRAASQMNTGPGIAAAILASGHFGDLAPGLSRFVTEYAGTTVPLALWSAEFDPAPVEIGVAELYLALCRKYRQCPSMQQMHGHNQLSQLLSLGTADTQAQDGLIRFYHTVR